MVILKMEQNVGKTDKIIRTIIAIGFVYIAYAYSWWWLIVSILLLFTVITGHCGPYKLLGINTYKVKSKK